MPPRIVDTERPDQAETAPRGVRPASAPPRTDPPPRAARSKSAGAGRTTPPPSGTTDAALKESITDFTGMIGMMVMGAGYAQTNPGLLLAGCNIVQRGDTFADSAIVASRQHPKLRAALTRLSKSGALAVFVGEGLALAAPVAAALVPHPLATAIANRSIAPEAHAMALEVAPEMFQQTTPTQNGDMPGPESNSTMGAA